MLTLTRPTQSQKDEVQIHVCLINNLFFDQKTDEQMQTLSRATGMSYAPFVDFFATMVNNNETNALNSPLYSAFKHCFPYKQVIIDKDEDLFERVKIIDRQIDREEAVSIVTDLLERVHDDYTKVREVQAILNVIEKAQPETYTHWIRLARIAAVGEALDQKHVVKD